MKQDCHKYSECRKPAQLCNSRCAEYQKNNFKPITGGKDGRRKRNINVLRYKGVEVRKG